MIPALHSWSCRERFRAGGFTAHDFITLAADTGYTAVELMTGKAGGVEHIASDEPQYLAELVSFAASKGVRIACWSTYNDFAFVPNEEWRLANIAYIKHWLQLAGETGVPNIRMLTGYRVAGVGDIRLQQLVLDGIKECIPFAERAGVNMAIENHNSLFFEAEDIRWLIDHLGSQRITTCPDPSNWASRAFLEGNGTPAEHERVFAGAASLAPLATESHFKVFSFNEAGTISGWGDDITRLTGIYKQAGYKGCLAVEYVGNGVLEDDLPRAHAILSAAIAATKTQKAHA
jgi:L-ribulose-5-phosphate 3-epimerase